MKESDVVLALVHSLGDLKSAVRELEGVEQAAYKELTLLLDSAITLEKRSQTPFAPAVPSRASFARRLKEAARQAHESGGHEGFEAMLQEGRAPASVFGMAVRREASSLHNADRDVRDFLAAKSELVRGLVRVWSRRQHGEPLIMHSLLSLTFGRLLTSYRAVVRVLVDGNDRGATNTQITLTVASYTVSLATSAPYTPISQTARIQPLSVCRVLFT